jgi:predicted RNase H-like HicB family nuclease
MQTAKYIHWQEDDKFIGYFVDYPDYWTQGESFDDLKEHLVDLFHDLTGDQIPGIRKVDELAVS